MMMIIIIIYIRNNSFVLGVESGGVALYRRRGLWKGSLLHAYTRRSERQPQLP